MKTIEEVSPALAQKIRSYPLNPLTPVRFRVFRTASACNEPFAIAEPSEPIVRVVAPVFADHACAI